MKAEEGDGARGIGGRGALVKSGVGVPGSRKNNAVLVGGHQLGADALFELEYQVAFHDSVAAVRSRVLPSVPGIEDHGGQALTRRDLPDLRLLSSLGLRLILHESKDLRRLVKRHNTALRGREHEVATPRTVGWPEKKGESENETRKRVSSVVDHFGFVFAKKASKRLRQALKLASFFSPF